MEKKPRLTGIDLFRGLAVFAVTIVHSDEGVTNAPKIWYAITDFSGSFAVPFFLATSFYFAINKLSAYRGNYPLLPRLKRLLIPYLFWSLAYLAYKIIKYLLAHEFDSFNNLFNDPISLIFLGGAAFHLYFLPLLACGTILLKFLEKLVKKPVNYQIIILLCVMSFFTYGFIIASQNSFQLGTNIAFESLINLIFNHENTNQFLRLVLVVLAWVIRCLPYIFVAIILNHNFFRLTKAKVAKKYLLFWILIFCIFNYFGEDLVPKSVYEVSMGYLALILAFLCSNYLPHNSIIKNLGMCSFGIYLLHLLVIEIFYIIDKRLFSELIIQTSTLSLLLVSLLSFLISWIATSVLIKRKLISRLMFGL